MKGSSFSSATCESHAAGGKSRCTDDDDGDDGGGDHDELHSNDFLCYEGIVTTLLLLLREMGIEERSLASISDYFHITH